MEQITLHGLNIRDTDYGEYDRIITFVTLEMGKISVMAKGAKSLKCKYLSACQPFVYSTLTLNKGKGMYYLSESETIESFYDIRTDITKIALASYLADVCGFCSVENQTDENLLRLTLNALFALSKDNAVPEKIKAAFELRLAVEIGFCPDLSHCAVCECEKGTFYLDIMNGRLLCKECKPRTEKEQEISGDMTARLYFLTDDAVLCAMRHIVYSPLKKFLSFNIDGDELHLLGQCTETYITNHLETKFPTLNFYKSLI